MFKLLAKQALNKEPSIPTVESLEDEKKNTPKDKDPDNQDELITKDRDSENSESFENEPEQEKIKPPIISWLTKKKQVYKACKKDPRILKEHMEWPYLSSEEELEKKIKTQAKLRAGAAGEKLLADWNEKKSIYRILRPRRKLRNFPIRREIVRVIDNHNNYDEIIEYPVEKNLTNDEIFNQLPLYFQENPFFEDLDDKLNTNYFKVREPIEFLKQEGGVDTIGYAKTMMNLITVAPKREKIKSTPINIVSSESEECTPDILSENRSTVSAKASIVNEECKESKTSKKSKESKESKESKNIKENKEPKENKDIIEIKENKESKEVKETKEINNPKEEGSISKSDAGGILEHRSATEVKMILDDNMRAQIIKKASLYRQEFSLKSIKGYFNKWKRKVEKLNDKIFKNIQKTEENRGKDMVEKSLIQRENIKQVSRKKSTQKELYYQEAASRVKLEHALPTKLSKFIKNCNNIYTVCSNAKKNDDDDEEEKDTEECTEETEEKQKKAKKQCEAACNRRKFNK